MSYASWSKHLLKSFIPGAVAYYRFKDEPKGYHVPGKGWKPYNNDLEMGFFGWGDLVTSGALYMSAYATIDSLCKGSVPEDALIVGGVCLGIRMLSLSAYTPKEK